MRYPRADGTTMSQIELYSVLTNTSLDLSGIAQVVAPIIRAAQSKQQEESSTPEIVVLDV